jgi:hypothetical protein
VSGQRLVAWGLAVGAVLLLVGARPSRAGARIWSFLVLDVTAVDGDAHLIRLQPSPPGKEFPQSCSNLLVYARYDLASWTEQGRQLVTREAHDRSLRLLLQAQATRGIVRVGAIARGFGRNSEDPECEVVSRGFNVLTDPAGALVIFSVYEEPAVRGGDAAMP